MRILEELEKVKQFFKEAKVESKKVNWPSRKQTAASTLVVIIMVIIISFFLGLVDFGLSHIMERILGR